MEAAAGTYGYDRSFLEQHTDVIELTSGTSRVAVVPQYQGRVMTSTCNGDAGASFGWINYDLIKSGKTLEHMNAFGGEERLWLGPEGGQYSVFFKAGDPFDFEHWFTPAAFDTEKFDVVKKSPVAVTLEKTFQLSNYSGTAFSINIRRSVRILDPLRIERDLGLEVGNDVQVVGYESENVLTNKGEEPWEKERGLLSIWMLGMLKPSDQTVIIVPFNEGPEDKLGKVVNDNYFGAIGNDRLKVMNDHILFKADGKKRGKIGIPPLRTRDFMGSYDFKNKVLTLLRCELPPEETDYVNSAWELQKEPFSGDAFNAYNDGPLENGTQLGPFYELETSSPAAALVPGDSLIHKQATYHLTGDERVLDKIMQRTLGVTVEEIKAF